MKVTPELVAETVRFCAGALRRQAAEVEMAGYAACPEAALRAIESCLLSKSLVPLAQDPIRLAAKGSSLSLEIIDDALGTYGSEADRLWEMLEELCDDAPSVVFPLFGGKVPPADA